MRMGLDLHRRSTTGLQACFPSPCGRSSRAFHVRFFTSDSIGANPAASTSFHQLVESPKGEVDPFKAMLIVNLFPEKVVKRLMEVWKKSRTSNSFISPRWKQRRDINNRSISPRKGPLIRLENVVRGTICGAIRHKLIPTPQNLVTSTPLTTTYESFFGLHPLSQVLDRTNPLTQIVHGRKSSYLGPGGLTGRTASFRIRDIYPSHYGRICPIDTSEGINVGLIGSLAIHAKIDHWGSLESPFYEISEGSKKVRMFYLSPNSEEYYMLAAGNSLALNRGVQEEQVAPARYRQEFLTIAWEQVHLRSIFPFQYFSIGASLIPFIEHNDANRALMSSNMQRQAVPLSRSEKCIVGTGLERQAALDSGVPAIAEHEGKIIYTDIDKIILSGNGDTLRIPLVMYERSNKNTCMHQKTQVQQGKCIKKGQVLADGAATIGGELALGKNVLVAYMPWEGYNFEDAVLISERLVYEDIYTSFHIRKYEIQTHVTSQGPERITNEISHLEDHLLRNLDKKVSRYE
ncbi:DNA-directed RNA polymerase subunit beta-like [Euphorbia lathyris]|uniref:DNA-directed RNA polymerase subunit beta-like n=1 Tax=Euphorbia lathyris TaxID=212925 RepID=UPI0033138D5B